MNSFLTRSPEANLMSSAISIEDLTFTYQGNARPALQNIQGKIEDGTFVAVMGHGGAGKSTLCCTLNALVPKFFRGKYQGRVLVRGQDVARHRVSEMSRLVGLVLQDFEAQLFSTNVELEMAFGPENHCLPRQEIERRIQRYLSFVGLEELRDREPASLSGGQKQRLAIGSVLALEPRILVMDEPTTDLDPLGREEVLSVTKSIREGGRILLTVDHEPETAVTADQVWLMRDGRLVSQGSPSEILWDVTTMESCGIKTLPMVELFHSMNWPGKPLTVDAAIELIQKHHLTQRRDLKTKRVSPDRPKGFPFLIAEGLRYSYPTYPIEALRGIDLSVQEGEFIAILGQNGSGKTTLAKHFNGLFKPSSGRMLVQNKPTTEYSRRELARLVGYVFQNPDHQIFARTVADEVGFGLKMQGEAPETIERRVAEVLEVVGLQGYEQKVPFALTKGERQRVAVASVLAAQPQVIILDEPTTGLDYRHQRNMMEMLKRLNRYGHTIVIITHSMWVAAEYANRTIVMKNGCILSDGPTRWIFFDENRLAEASLCPPSLVRLSNWLGTEALAVQRMVRELTENNGRPK
ncbi:MAG TPA: energy-coupling factor transporter ATPase [Thermodesulfobacteriota bacterium]|nr:energy-coupling factor transporter ATPase [Thermodesulfobacteriota bacterium]